MSQPNPVLVAVCLGLVAGLAALLALEGAIARPQDTMNVLMALGGLAFLVLLVNASLRRMSGR